MALLSMPRMRVKASISALPSVIKDREITTVYRTYMSDCLKVLTENTAKYFGGNYAQVRYIDIVTPKSRDIRSGEEIAADVIQKTGLTMIASN